MRRLGRVLLIAVILAAVAVVGLWLAAGSVLERARGLAEREAARALNLPVSIPSLDVTWLPPAVHVKDITIGPDGSALRVRAATVRLLPRESLRELRPVADVEAEGVFVNPPLIDRATTHEEKKKEGPKSPPPAFQIRRARVRDARVRVSDDEDRIDIAADRVSGSFGIGGPNHWISFSGSAHEIVMDWNGRTLSVAAARARGEETALGLSLTRASAIGNGLFVKGGARAGLELTHRAHADVDIQRLAVIDELFANFHGRAVANVTFHGKLDKLRSDATATIQGLMLKAHPIGDFQGDIHTHGPLLEVSDGRLQGLGGAVLLAGSLGFKDPSPLKVEGTLGGLQLPQITNLVAEVPAPLVDAGGRFSLTGTLKPLSLVWDVNGTFSAEYAGDFKPIDWSSTGHYDDPGGGLEVSMNQAGVNTMHARVTLARDEKLEGDLSVRVNDTNALRSLTGPVDVAMVRGTLNANGRLSGSLQRPVWTATVDGRNVQAFGVLAQTLSGSVTIDPEQVQADRVVAVLDKGSVDFGGTIALDPRIDNAWQVQVWNVPTNTLVSAAQASSGTELPLWGGQLNASLAAWGAWSRVSLSGSVRWQNFYVGNEPFEALTVQFGGLWPAWKADLDLTHRPEEALVGTISGKGTDEIDLAVAASDWDLSRLRGAALEEISGKVSLDADVHGPPKALSGQVGFTGTDVVWDRRRFGNLRLDARADRGRWQLDGDVGNLVRLDGTLQPLPGYPFTLTAQWEEADLGPFAGADPPIEIGTTGRIEIRGRLDGLRQIDADIGIDSLGIKQGGYAVHTTEPIRVRARGGRFTIDSLKLAGDNAELRLEGAWATNGELDLRLIARGDLGFAEVLGEPIMSAQGQIEATADIDRTVAGRWDLAGTIRLADGELDLGLPFVLSDVNAELDLHGPTIRVAQLAGEVGGGTFSIGGAIDVANGPDLTWSVTQMTTGLVESLEDEISARGTVRGQWNDLTVAGTVEILQALYTRKIKITDLLPSFKKSVKPPPDIRPTTANIHLDVWIRAPGDIFVDNNFAKLELRTNIHVTGTVRDVVLSGPVELIDGTVTVQGRKFDITTGVIDFRPELGLNPTVNIRGETVVSTRESSRTISVDVSGTAEEFRVALGGDDPNLSQTDVVSVLATGQTRAEAQASGGGVSAGDLVTLAPGIYGERLQEGVQQFIPLDRIEVEPTLSPTTGTLQPRLSLGKDLTEKLTAEVGSTFGVETYRSLNLRYQLTPRTQVVGLWESATEEQSGAFGGEIRFQYRYIGWPRFSLIRPWGVVDVD